MSVLSPSVGYHALLRCASGADCPSGGYCFRDECARCLCGRGMQELDYFHDGVLAKMCLIREFGVLISVDNLEYLGISFNLNGKFTVAKKALVAQVSTTMFVVLNRISALKLPFDIYS